MNCRQATHILFLLGLAMAGCQQASSPKASPPESEFDVFVQTLFKAANAGDIDAIVNDLCTTKDDVVAEIERLKAKNPELEIVGDVDAISDEEIKQSHRHETEVFLDSYRDEFKGTLVAADARETLRGNLKAIIWVKMPSGKFHGIVIASLIETDTEVKVGDWLGPPADRNKSQAQRVKKRATLVRDTMDALDFPESIKYEEAFKL